MVRFVLSMAPMTRVVALVSSEPHEELVRWLDAAGPLGGRRALVVGCGLGDDAVEVARRGAATTAFDLSPTAVAWCRRRFPDAPVTWTTADLLATPPAVAASEPR